MSLVLCLPSSMYLQSIFTVSLTTNGSKVLLAGLLTKVRDVLGQMVQMPWGSWSVVGDQSPYVTQFSTYVAQTVPLYNDWLSPIHFRVFCEAVAG